MCITAKPISLVVVSSRLLDAAAAGAAASDAVGFETGPSDDNAQNAQNGGIYSLPIRTTARWFITD